MGSLDILEELPLVQELASCICPCEDQASDQASDLASGLVCLDEVDTHQAQGISEDRWAERIPECSLVLVWRRVETATAVVTVESQILAVKETGESLGPLDCRGRSSEETFRPAGWPQVCLASPSAPAAGDCYQSDQVWEVPDCWEF